MKPAPENPNGRPAAASRAADEILDELLVLRAREGQRSAFEELAERWQDRLWRHAYRLTGRQEVAWDVLQESWMAVARGMVKLRSAAAFRRWAYTIVTRVAARHARRHARERPAAPEDLDARPHDEESSEREQAIELLRGALRAMSNEERTLLSLRYLEEFELWELAQILGVPEGTVKSRLHRARGRLKKILETMQR